MKGQEDSYYVQRCIEGDASAFGVLVERHQEMAFTIALKIVRNREDAEEIAQDSFVKAYQSLRSFKGDSKFSTWLFRIVYNGAISHTRKHQIEFAAYDENLLSNHTENEIMENLDKVDAEQQSALVRKAINRLPAEEGALVTLFYMEENTIEDISRITGLSVSNVKVKLFRIRKKLYDDLQFLMKQDNVMA